MSTNFDQIFNKMQGGLSNLDEVNKAEEVSKSISSTSTQLREPFKHFLMKEPKIINKSDVVYTFVHGDSQLRPIEHINEAKFTSDIHHKLSKRGYRVVFPIQAYSWNEICANRNVTIINPKGSGKTFAYLPSLLTLLSDIDLDVERTQGAIAIIFVSSARQVDSIFKTCLDLVSLEKVQISTAFGKWNCEKIQIRLLNGIHLLITTLPCFLRLVKQSDGISFFNNQRIKHLVFDNLNAIMEKHKDELIEGMNLLNLSKAHPEKNPQIIVTSTTWQSINKEFLKYSSHPIVIIGDHIEAAIYSNARFFVMRLSFEDKQKRLLAHLKSFDHTKKKTIIFVSNDIELIEMEEFCRQHFVDYICLKSNESEEIPNDFWVKNDSNKMKIVIANDETMTKYRIKNAQIIIHYTLPKNWTLFTKRFSASFDYYKKYISTNISSDKNDDLKPISVVMMDLNNCKEIPRMVNFLSDHRLDKYVPDKIRTLIEKYKLEKESSKIAESLNNAYICSNTLAFGKCDTTSCCKRHVFINQTDKPKYLPTGGEIKFEIYGVRNPVHYAIKIMEVLENGRDEWYSWNEENVEIEKMLKNMQEHYNDSDNCMTLATFEVGDMCAYSTYSKWYRAEIENIEDKDEDSFAPVNVIIHLIDKGEKIKTKSSHLYVLPDELKDIRPLVFYLRIANFIPFDKDDYFDNETKHNFEVKILKSNLMLCDFAMSEIALTVQNTIISENLYLIKYLAHVEKNVIKFSLKEVLKDFAVYDASVMERLKKLAFNVELHNDKKCQKVVKIVEKVNEPTWIDLENGEKYEGKLGSYNSPDLFFIHLPDAYNLIVDKFKTYDETSLKKIEKIKRGAYCLYHYEDYGIFRSKIIDDVNLTILLLDFGASKKCEKSKLYEMPNELFSDPFTSVKCKLTTDLIPKFKKESWSEQYSMGIKLIIKQMLKNQNTKLIPLMKLDENSYEVTFVNDEDNIVDIVVEEGLADLKCAEIKKPHEHLLDILSREEFIADNEGIIKEIFPPVQNLLNLPPQMAVSEKKSQSKIAPTKLEKPGMEPIKLKPQLTPLHQHPKIEWYQKDAMIIVKVDYINAETYSLKIDEDSIQILVKYSNGSLKFAKIDFYAMIRPEYSSHNISGYFIRIRLVKRAIDLAWPRLSKNRDFDRYIKYCHVSEGDDGYINETKGEIKKYLTEYDIDQDEEKELRKYNYLEEGFDDYIDDIEDY